MGAPEKSAAVGTFAVRAAISGLRDGEPWPAVGEHIELPIAEGSEYARFGYVERVEVVAEAAPSDDEIAARQAADDAAQAAEAEQREKDAAAAKADAAAAKAAAKATA